MRTLKQSAALLAAGRPHSVLPIPGVSHLTTGAGIAASLMIFQAKFLLDALSPVREPA